MSLKNFILDKNKNYQFRIIETNEINTDFFKLIKKEKQDFDKFKKYLKNIELKKLSNFLFFLRVLDFRLWEFPKNWQFKNEKGFYGLLLKTKNLFNINFNKIDFDIFRKLISPKENYNLANLRYKIFKQALAWLNKNYDGDFLNYFEENKNPLKFCLNLFYLKKFKDYYRNFYFLKPNQLLYFEFIIGNKLDKKFKTELEELTVFVDYKLPQLFINFNLISLPKNILNKIKNKKNIKTHSILENELRWASIILGENLSKKLALPSYLVDNLIWNLAHKIKFKIPYPKIKTIFY
ncbi:MAG: hypothetical protein KatS3mg097_550 [Candidatus Parcubacteria bacterium]|nr:MAG: hypothetical protein KatS3mg097_550 [Candidatus Parcubacteria bacterium]